MVDKNVKFDKVNEESSKEISIDGTSVKIDYSDEYGLWYWWDTKNNAGNCGFDSVAETKEDIEIYLNEK